MTKINVDIFGDPDKTSQGACSGCRKTTIAIKGKDNSSGGCSNCSGCDKEKTDRLTLMEQYHELETFISKSDVFNNVKLSFYDINKINVLDYDNIRILTELDYEAPFVVIDDIVRYYGAISKELIYKDVKELLL